jgi:hypothetical protein
MAHDRGHVVKRPNGAWVPVYGLGTPRPGERLPGVGEYETEEEAQIALREYNELGSARKGFKRLEPRRPKETQ